MSISEEYINEATNLIKLCIGQKNNSQEVKDIEKKCADLWSKMTEEEQYYADDQVMKIQLYLGHKNKK